MTKRRIARGLALTVGLALVGGFCGMASTVTALAIVFLSERWLMMMLGWPGLLVLGLGGGMLGAALAPAATWLLLRRVPLAAAFVALTGGAIAGGLAGWFAPVFVHPIAQPPLAAALGFTVAALLMRARHARANSARTATLDYLLSARPRSTGRS